MITGIDVSTLQGVIDWNDVNVDFAMIKATQGQGECALTRRLPRFTDSKFKANITSCKCPRGVYHYFTARTKADAKTEIDYFCNVIKPYKDFIDLWTAVDVESKYLDGLKKPELTDVVKYALDRVAEHGYRPMLYTNPNYLTYKFKNGAFDDYDIWLAHWGVKTPMRVPNLKIWQYGLATIPGIKKLCDGDYGYFQPNVPIEKLDKLPEYKVGDGYTLRDGDVYANGMAVPRRLWGKTYKVLQVMEDKILLGGITSWVRID